MNPPCPSGFAPDVSRGHGIADAEIRAAFDTLSELVAILDPDGVICVVNRAWRETAASIHPRPAHVETGASYWDAWDDTRLEFDPEAPDPVSGMQQVLAGSRSSFELEFSANAPSGLRWHVLVARRIEDTTPMRLLVTLSDITRRKSTEEALRRSEERFALAAEGGNDGIWEWNIATGEDFFSERWCRLLGYSHAELLPRISTWHHHLHPDDHDRVLEAIRAHLRHHTPFDVELRLRSKNGVFRWFRYRGQAVWDKDGAPVRMAGSMTDITPLKEQEATLRELNEHLEDLVQERTDQLARSEGAYRDQARLLEAVFHSMGDGLVVADAQERFTHFNPAAERLLAGEDADFDTASATLTRGIYRPDGVTTIPREELPLARALRGESIDQEELYLRDAHRAEPLILSATARPIRSPGQGIQAAVVVFRDITEHKRAVEATHRSLSEKETLLKEIHHRVKNNLQVIISILRLQAARVSDPELRAVFMAAKQRVRTMALIHERLYRSADLSRIDFGGHLADLARMLLNLYRPPPSGVTLTLDVASIPLELDVAVPLGLIANELISNSLKYGFPNGRTGTLAVHLERTQPAGLRLVIQDDGVGLDPAFDWNCAESLGLRIVRTLVDQLRGTLHIQGHAGLTVALTFRFPTPDLPTP
ncbi:MAG: PAS domain S-box protein [Verrucomicrobiales bacterium]|nr:PAS domain S-box protein [Verrucomicrobiales bacterium]